MMKKILLILFASGLASFAQAQLSCADALTIELGLHTVDSVHGDEIPQPICADNGDGAENGMWYSFTPEMDMNILITTDLEQNSGGDTRFHVYTGECGSLTCVGGDDDAGDIGNGYLSIDEILVQEGQTYYIAFDDRWNSGGFDFEISEFEVEVPYFLFQELVVNTTGTVRGAVDMNNDNLDDLLSVSSNSIQIHYQQSSGLLIPQTIPTEPADNNPSWSLAAGDIDGNGWNDLVYGGGSGVSIMFASDEGDFYSEFTTPDYVFSQRSNMVDINMDGHLDVFVCHDVDTNVYYMNDGLGNLEFIKGGLGDLFGGGNYGSIWTDYDKDGDTDLFIAKCRGGNSLLSINQMHRNNGDGTYTEVAEEIGLADSVQTWSSAWGDFDNDGDMDVFVGASSFSDGGHKLMLNDGIGNFSDITEGSGFDTLQGLSIEWVTHDFDNDGYLDVMGAGFIMRNNGDLTFTPHEIPFDNGPIGDFNHDGFLDVYRNNIRLNYGNSNNYLIVHTNGVVSNTNGIGAWIEVYSTSFNQIREVRSGDGFRYMSTLNAHFGLGTDSEIDSVIVHWPSGLIDIIYNPEINSTLEITEGQAPLSAQNQASLEFLVYPNPADEMLFVQAMASSEPAEFSIFDIQGRRIHSAILTGNSLDISWLESGTYILQIRVDGKTGTQKFLKL